MRILHIITSLRTGGAERLLVDLLPRLQKRGHEVELALFDGTPTPFLDQLKQQGIAVHVLGMGFRDMYNPFHIFRLRKFFKGDFDIVHTHNTSCQLFAALACSNPDVRLITTEHNTFNRRRGWNWYRRLDKWMYGKYRNIICVGEETRRNLAGSLNSECLSRRMQVVPNGIDLQRFISAKPDDALRSNYGGKYVVVMVGAFREQKDQSTLIRAMRLLPDDYKLWLVGDGECRAECEILVWKLKLDNKVLFWGNRSDIPQIFASANVVVLSSHYEGFGLSAVEGMAAGKATILSDVAGLKEIAGDAALLFPHEDFKQLAALICWVCKNEELNKLVAARCRERSLLYDVEQMVEKYDRIYREKE